MSPTPAHAVRLRAALALGVTLHLAGCGTPGPGGAMDGAGEVPDAFVEARCATAGDCDDGDPCTRDTCALDPPCAHAPVSCAPLDDDCHAGVCVPETGACEARPAHDGAACSTRKGEAGACRGGFCDVLPLCAVGLTQLACDRAPLSGTTSGASAVDGYTCAQGLTGPERAFPLLVTTDRVVTLTLTSAADLDLLVLEGGLCVATAVCAAQSTTAGTGTEQITFTAKAGFTYTVVVEGRDGAAGDFTLDMRCAGGQCAPMQALACNTSVMGDTSRTSATLALATYGCGFAPGPEETYTLKAAQTTRYRLKLTGPGQGPLAQDLELFVLRPPLFTSTDVCDPTGCKERSINLGTAGEELALDAFGGTTYSVVVDSKTVGAPYLLEVLCPPSCYTAGNTLGCLTRSDTRQNDDATRSSDRVDAWACAPGTTGPEVVYRFSPPASGMYRVDLDGLSADLDLIVLEGGFTSCDGSAPCLGQGVKTGAQAESVTVALEASHDYYLAVDGKAGAVSGYTLSVTPLQAGLCP